MSNNVKWMHSGMPNAPVLTNNWGSLTALLDACLVNGWNLQSASALTRTETTATLTLNAGHGFMVDQVILVAGADQAAYNGEFTVTAVDSTHVSYTVTGSPVSPATGAMTVKMAPLGFEIAFTGTNKRVYRSPNPLSNRAYLRVDDSLPSGYTTTYAKFGRITIAEGMSDIDTFVGARAPYDPALPTKNEVPSGSGSSQYTGWFKWHFARTGSTGSSDAAGDGGNFARSWVLVGDDRGFYFPCSSGQFGNVTGDHRVLYSFTDFLSFKTGDAYASVLLASERYANAGTVFSSYPPDEAPSLSNLRTTGTLCMRNFTQVGDNCRLGPLSLNDGNAQSLSNRSAYFNFPNGPDYSLILHPVYLKETVSLSLRGILPGIYWIHQNQPYPHLSVIGGVTGFPNQKFLIVTYAWGSEGNVTGCAFDLTGPWRDAA